MRLQDGENYPHIISIPEANTLADFAAAEAEADAQRLFPDELPPSPEPLYGDNPWRLGLTARSKERGAGRIFPCFMITPHALAGPTAAGKGVGTWPQGRAASTTTNSSIGSPRVIPPETSALEPPYRRILPSSTASISSTVDLPSELEEPA